MIRPIYYLLNEENEAVACNDFKKYLYQFEFKRINMVVGLTIIKKKYKISTMFTCIDLSLSGPPKLFDTMVVEVNGTDYVDLEREKYSTYDQAVEGHEKYVRKYLSD